MSPEQTTGDGSIDARSDVYALGAVLFEMLAGEPPFTGASYGAIVAKRAATGPSFRSNSAFDGSPRNRRGLAARARA
jgi:serine/threonine protein kinase